MKTSELTGHALNWAVAKCEGMLAEPWLWGDEQEVLIRYKFSTNWAQGGPIIEREDIAISPLPDGLWRAYAPDGTTRWLTKGSPTPTSGVEVFNWTYKQQGYHPLIAAMRCYVASKLGHEVEIPSELTQGESK